MGIRKMKLRYHILAGVFALLCPGTALGATVVDLPQVIAQLSSEDETVVCDALEKMGRICDESCVTYVADMMRHPNADVVRAACKTAQVLANPRLAPALQELVRNYPMDDIRVEALKALMTIGAGYDALLLTVDPEHPDGIQRLIIRSLPRDMAIEKADEFAHLAGFHAYSTSVAAAFREQPDPLFRALLRNVLGADDDARHNMLRTMLLLAPDLKDKQLTESEELIFWEIPRRDLELAACIQAERSTPDAVRWILSRIEEISPAGLLDIFHRLNGEGERLLADAIVKGENQEWVEKILDNPAIKQELIAHLPKDKTSQEVALSALREEGMHIAAIRTLAIYDDDPQIRQIIASELGNSDHHAAMAAMHIMMQSAEYMPDLIRIVVEHSDDDLFGSSYLARWAILAAISGKRVTPELSWKEQLRSEALNVVSDLRRLHAEPALRLLIALGEPLPSVSADAFRLLRSDIKRALLGSTDIAELGVILEDALHDEDLSVVAAALDTLGNHPSLAEPFRDLDEWLKKWIESDDAMLSIQASATAGKLGRTACIDVLQKRLTDTDTRVAYNALWALQQLRALPNEHWLKALYYRAPVGILRERLGFLTGLDPNRTERMPMSELYSRKRLIPGQAIQMTMQDEPLAGQDIPVILEDQSMRILRANVFGIIFL